MRFGTSAIGKTGAMPAETVTRRWTIATWLVAGHPGDVEAIAVPLDALGADAIALQSVREHDVEQVAAALGANHVWAKSHHPRARLFPGSAVGLALLTPHRIRDDGTIVVSEARSLWSRRRRIAQVATVERPDHSAYAIGHCMAPGRDGLPFTTPTGGAPAVTIRPVQVGIDAELALDLPDGATPIDTATSRPVADMAELLSVTFEMPWVQGDFPV